MFKAHTKFASLNKTELVYVRIIRQPEEQMADDKFQILALNTDSKEKEATNEGMEGGNLC